MSGFLDTLSFDFGTNYFFFDTLETRLKDVPTVNLQKKNKEKNREGFSWHALHGQQ
jgi:hypothetical protein